MKLILKLLYFCAVIAVLVTGIKVDKSVGQRTFEHVGEDLSDDWSYDGETVILEWEQIDIDFFTSDVDLYDQSPEVLVKTPYSEEALCLNDVDWYDESNTIKNSSKVYLSGEVYREFDIVGILIVLAYVLFLIVIPFAVWVRSAQNKRYAKKENAREYYEKCRSLKIRNTDTKEDQEKLLIVAKNFGYTTLKEAIEHYRIGEAQAKVHKENKKQAALLEERKKDILAQQEIEKKRAEERRQYTAEKNFSENTGKKKYTSILDAKIKALQEECKAIEKIDAFAPFMHHEKDNWGWVGGIAEGIAGPGAGVVAAMEARERTASHNRAVDQYNTNLINSGYDPGKIEDLKRQKLKPIKEKIEKLEEYKKALDQVLINDDSSATDFNKLKFTVTGSVIEETSNLLLNVSVKVTEPITLLDQKAIVDGSVLIHVLDKNNKKVGEAYYNACDTETYKLGEAGFGHSKQRSVMAVPTGKQLFDKNESYHYEVKPNSIWTIEIC